MSSKRAAILGFSLIIFALCLPVSVLIWRAWQAQSNSAWGRYTDRGLQISWSAPVNWEGRALNNPAGRTLVLTTPDAPRAVLYLSNLYDVAAYRRWDPAAVNTSVAGMPAISEWLPNGQNPPQRQVSFRLGSDRLVILILMYDPSFDMGIFERILASLKAEVETAHERGARFGYLITSNCMGLLESIAEAGVDVVVGVDPHAWDLHAAKDALRGRVCLWGGVNGHLTLEAGSADAVRAEVRESLEVLGEGGGFILSPVDNVREDSHRSRENVKALVDEWTSFCGSRPTA